MNETLNIPDLPSCSIVDRTPLTKPPPGRANHAYVATRHICSLLKPDPRCLRVDEIDERAVRRDDPLAALLRIVSATERLKQISVPALYQPRCQGHAAVHFTPHPSASPELGDEGFQL